MTFGQNGIFERKEGKRKKRPPGCIIRKSLFLSGVVSPVQKTGGGFFRNGAGIG